MLVVHVLVDKAAQASSMTADPLPPTADELTGVPKTAL